MEGHDNAVNPKEKEKVTGARHNHEVEAHQKMRSPNPKKKGEVKAQIKIKRMPNHALTGCKENAKMAKTANFGTHLNAASTKLGNA